MNSLDSRKSIVEHESNKILRVLSTIILLEMMVFLGVYYFLLEFRTAVILTSALSILSIVMRVFVYKAYFNIGRWMLVLIVLAQVTVSSYILFETMIYYKFYYIILVPIVYLLFDFEKIGDRTIIISMTVLSSILFGLNDFIDYFRVDFVATEFVIVLLNSLIAVGVFVAVFSFIWIFATSSINQQKALNRLANTDGLTNILNRRAFFEMGEEIFMEDSKSDEHFSLIIFDIDFFKQVNDQHGHIAGDMVLRDMAKLVLKSIRKQDLFARYGGEEFAIYLRDTTAEDGLKRAEEIRWMVENKGFDIGEEDLLKTTISVGVSSYVTTSIEFEQALKKTDKALYLAKESGRNNVVQV